MVPALVGPLSAVGSEPRYPSRSDIPEWWRNTRAFCCPWENSGAGASLMKFKAHRDGGFESFNDLDKVLDDARRLGTSVLYLVGYWEPDYEHKAEYRPKLKWGGDTRGHRLSPRHREGALPWRAGDRLPRSIHHLTQHRPWSHKRAQRAMMDETGRCYPYYGTGDRFYLMYPGPGSGWTDYLVEVAARLARDFQIDGVHLDSYGLQWGWKNHNPAHPEGRNPESFNRGAVELVRRVRDEMRKHVPDAVVILEGAEHTALLDVFDGAQIESLPVIHRKPWAAEGRYPVFTSSFSIEEMGRILDEGHNLAISPWWLMARPARRDEKTLLAQTDKRSRFDQIEALHRYHNILLVNGRLPQPVADFDGLSQGILEHLNRNGWTSRFSHPPLVEAAQRYIAAYNRDEGRLTRVPVDLIRQMLLAASSRTPAASRPG